MLEDIDSGMKKKVVMLYLPVEVAIALRSHSKSKGKTPSKYVLGLLEADMKPRPSDDPMTQLRGNW